MKSLPIFLIYLKKKNKFQGILWVCENPKVNVTQRSPWESIYLNSSHEKWIPTSLLMLDAWLMNGGRLFFFITLVLWVVRLWSICYWFHVIQCHMCISLLCLTNMDHIKCFMLWKFLPLHVVLDMILELIVGFFWLHNNWLFSNLEFLHFALGSIVKKLIIKYSSN